MKMILLYYGIILLPITLSPWAWSCGVDVVGTSRTRRLNLFWILLLQLLQRCRKGCSCGTAGYPAGCEMGCPTLVSGFVLGALALKLLEDMAKCKGRSIFTLPQRGCTGWILQRSLVTGSDWEVVFVLQHIWNADSSLEIRKLCYWLT